MRMNARSRYTLVLLDADGTLFDFDAASAAAFRGASAELLDLASVGVEIDPFFARYRVINHGIWAELERGEIDKERLKAERFRRLFAEFGIGCSASDFSVRFLELLAEGNQLLPGAEAFVRALAASGKRMAIVTNGISAVQRGRFARTPLMSLIPDHFISEELGAEKPSRIFFAEAFRRLGRKETDTADVALVGDSWSADIEGALGFGLDAVWYNPAGKPMPSLSPRVKDARSYAEILAVPGMS